MKSMLLTLLISTLILSSPAWADCKSDCKDQFNSEIKSCNPLNDDPEDSDMLKMCIDSAKDEYDSCIAECEDEYETTQVKHK